VFWGFVLCRWEKETYDAANEAQEREQETYQPDAVQKPTTERESIAEQAQALLKGKEKWKPTWVDSGPALGVGKDGAVPR